MEFRFFVLLFLYFFVLFVIWIFFWGGGLDSFLSQAATPTARGLRRARWRYDLVEGCASEVESFRNGPIEHFPLFFFFSSFFFFHCLHLLFINFIMFI